jgi:hypothetical protein
MLPGVSAKRLQSMNRCSTLGLPETPSAASGGNVFRSSTTSSSNIRISFMTKARISRCTDGGNGVLVERGEEQGPFYFFGRVLDWEAVSVHSIQKSPLAIRKSV